MPPFRNGHRRTGAVHGDAIDRQLCFYPRFPCEPTSHHQSRRSRGVSHAVVRLRAGARSETTRIGEDATAGVIPPDFTLAGAVRQLRGFAGTRRPRPCWWHRCKRAWRTWRRRRSRTRTRRRSSSWRKLWCAMKSCSPTGARSTRSTPSSRARRMTPGCGSCRAGKSSTPRRCAPTPRPRCRPTTSISWGRNSLRR